ncbi:MAG: phosphoglucosamine mutase [Planctomycetes bacterium]|nr:phosphoglucosamine mutase [Planctomycetota bacterium]
MAAELIVSVSGIRGIVGEGLTPEPALAFAAALGTYYSGGRIVLCRDSRPSGLMLRHAVLAGLMATGCEVHDLAVAPTPTCGLAVTRLQAAGAVQITASHNPAPWNGMKLFGADGGVLSASRGLEVKTIYDAGVFRFASWDKLGTFQECGQAETWHRERVLQLVDVTRIRSRGLCVFLDANGGAGGPLGRDLLGALQCQPVVSGGHADGVFEHPPEPLAENLTAVLPRVPQNHADAGFVLDPDADRLAIIDEQGRYIGEELTLALAVQCRLRQERGPVVINMSSSRVVEDVARSFGVPCHRAAVGEANVVERMRAEGAVIGGEGNGGVIDPRVGWVRDPFIGMGLVLDLIAESGKTLSGLVSELPAYAIVKDKYPAAPERLQTLYAGLEGRWPEATANRLDGIRLDWPDRWLHVRPSNTEPIVRVIAEAPTRPEAESLCREAGALVEKNSK